MDISDYQPVESRGRQAAVTAVAGVIACLLSFLIIGPILGLLVAIPFIDGDLLSLADKFSNPTAYPEFKVPLYIIQGVAAAVGLILTPWIFLVIRKEHPARQFFSTNKTFLGYLLTVVVVISFMGFNSLVIEWNSSIHLPDAFSALEEWAREKEELATDLTNFLTNIDSNGMFVLAFIVIAVIPGIGEEFVFRGVFQKKLQDSGINGHLAIWIAAIVFSSIHIQFFGFFPRLFLGALFGYLYWWSGDLKVSMLAHFVNNAFTLFLVYWSDQGIIDQNLEEPDSLPLATVLIMTIITAVLLIFLYNFWTRIGSKDSNWLKVYSTDKAYQAEIVKSALSESMNAVILNKKDSSYQFGHYEIHVPREDVMRALQIIENDITFQ